MPIVLNGSGPVTGVTSLNTTVSDTEIGYLDGVTSALQSQINTAGGLVKITDQAFSSVSSVSVNNCFSSTYRHYRLTIEFSASAGTDTNFRVRSSGSDETGATVYRYAGQAFSATGATDAINSNGLNLFRIGSHSGAENALSFDIFNPQATTTTFAHGILTGLVTTGTAARGRWLSTGEVATSTSYDGFTFYPLSGTITGTLRVYGYRN